MLSFKNKRNLQTKEKLPNSAQSNFIFVFSNTFNQIGPFSSLETSKMRRKLSRPLHQYFPAVEDCTEEGSGQLPFPLLHSNKQD
jgi:hypothetical protein